MDAVQERLARWIAPDQTHPLAKREADLAALVDGDRTAWESYGQHYEGWTMEDMERLLAGVCAARRDGP